MDLFDRNKHCNLSVDKSTPLNFMASRAMYGKQTRSRSFLRISFQFPTDVIYGQLLLLFFYCYLLMHFTLLFDFYENHLIVMYSVTPSVTEHILWKENNLFILYVVEILVQTRLLVEQDIHILDQCHGVKDFIIHSTRKSIS